METQDIITNEGFTSLHPAVQCTAIIVGAALIFSLYLLVFSDFWSNIYEKRKNDK